MSQEPNKPEELKRILILDDEQIVLVALRDTLAPQGYEPVCLANPLDALEVIKSKRFSVILTDQQMPTITGLEFLSQAKLVQPNATRILITAVLSLSTVIDAINKGEIYRFIVKPWLREELLVTMRNAVQRYELIWHNNKLYEETKAINQELTRQVSMVAAQNLKLDLLNQALEQNLERSVQLCLKTMETFYPALGRQARRVCELCRALADGLQLSKEDRSVLELSARLYNVGLVGIPRGLIRKWQHTPASLSPAEQLLIHHHPVLGQELVAFVHNLEPVGLVIRSHHERYDGQGYPDRLASDQIPWLASLLAVSVAYATFPTEGQAAADHLKSQSGSAFDPEAVRAFLRCLPQAAVPRNQVEVLLSELRPGMILAKGIYTSSGMLLIPAGQVLNAPYIDKLRNHHRVSPIVQNLVVYC